MADRRVERRNVMTGTGMMTDPERLEEIEEQRHHSELNARLPPKTTFKQALHAPQKSRVSNKPKRPVSDEKLRPTSQHAMQQMVGFADHKDEIDELLEDGERPRVVVKV
jgi:hypothetical protein